MRLLKRIMIVLAVIAATACEKEDYSGLDGAVQGVWYRIAQENDENGDGETVEVWNIKEDNSIIVESIVKKEGKIASRSEKGYSYRATYYDSIELTGEEGTFREKCYVYGNLLVLGERKLGERFERTYDSKQSSCEIRYQTGSSELFYPEDDRVFSSPLIHNVNDAEGRGIMIFHEPLTAIGQEAFADRTELQGISLPETVQTIGDNAFRGCTRLSSITLPENLKKIEDAAFKGCPLAGDLVLPETLEKVGREAFMGNSAVVSFTLPNSLRVIGADAFKGCTSLQIIECFSEYPAVVEDGLDDLPEQTVIKVPEELVETYKTSWSGVASRITKIEEEE